MRYALPALVLAALPGLAVAWTAVNRSEVTALGGDRFEVVNRNSSRSQDYWCAAGDYAIAALHTPATQRVYIYAAVGPSQTAPGRKGVTFSLSPPPGGPAPQTYSLSVKSVGDNLTAAAARQYCTDRMFPDF